jgi:hypothetical protein
MADSEFVGAPFRVRFLAEFEVSSCASCHTALAESLRLPLPKRGDDWSRANSEWPIATPCLPFAELYNGEVTVASHQPGYLPWSGLFQKALRADLLVLLDNVQFPRGQSWVNRNRIKGALGVVWLTVPVRKKGRGLQPMREVEIYNERDWSRKQLLTLRHSYRNAPYFDDYFPFLEETFAREWKNLVDLNLTVLSYVRDALGLETEFRLASSVGVSGRGTQLLVELCEKSESGAYLVSRAARKYLDESVFERKKIRLLFDDFRPPIYPQLWGEFIPNLSVIDLLFNCGEKSLPILERFCR